MPFELWLAYVATCAVVLAIPGPTILLVLSYAIAHGRSATLPVVAGVALGDSLAISLSLVGLGTLLATSAFWFTLIKWMGGLYLVYLGLRLILGSGKSLQLDAQPRQQASRKLFGNAFVVTALNPKSIVFFIALLPQFISAAHPLTAQLWILGVSFVAMAIVGATAYALFASSIRRLLASRRTQQAYGIVGGSLLCIAGIWALGAKRGIMSA